ncbi:energy-coupling factor ABC transporter ATP-binding protein [Selenomonas montiformis]|uniref:energy-coupling factor ABC transporter ATP-binding protein n=1 Tax=Selenomonas montiformis TaxID=2652285 RepID=UPI0012B610EB|nr:ABC transporter ATP-binding protein [Selenomonas montiformis]
MSILVFRDVCYAYEGEPVLRHVDFQAEKGQAVALCGPNGAGKSTLLRMVNGLIYPDIGSYTFEGTEITAARMRDHRYSKWFHQRVGLIWQNPDIQLFCGSVEDELAFGPRQMGLSEDEVKRRVDDALVLLGLERLRRRAPYTLSGGEKKKTAIASVLTMNPAVWTLDEPMSFLDAEAQEWLLDFLKSLKEAGKTLIFSTHESRMVRELADLRLDIRADHGAEVHAV